MWNIQMKRDLIYFNCKTWSYHSWPESWTIKRLKMKMSECWTSSFLIFLNVSVHFPSPGRCHFNLLIDFLFWAQVVHSRHIFFLFIFFFKCGQPLVDHLFFWPSKIYIFYHFIQVNIWQYSIDGVHVKLIVRSPPFFVDQFY